MPLRLTQVAKFYSNTLVFKDVSLALRPAEALLLVGPNGAGKSTLLKIMAGLSRPSHGTVERDIPRERVGYLGHNTFLYPRLTGLENLRFWARMHGQKPEAVRLTSALERVELAAAADDRVGAYSRGMAQRLGLARVFLLAPGLLLLDEPGAGLDTRSMDILRRELRAAKERGAALVWVSHQVKDDLAMVDRVLAIEKKRVAFLGPAAEFGPRTRHPAGAAKENAAEKQIWNDESDDTDDDLLGESCCEDDVNCDIDAGRGGRTC